MTPRIMTRKTAGITLAAALGAVPLGLGAVGTAQAATAPSAGDGGPSTMSCSHSHSNQDADSGYVDADWLRYRSGPHTSCAAKGQAADGTKIYYHCYTTTNNDGTWTWGRVAGTSHQGWFSDDYLSDGGSLERC